MNASSLVPCALALVMLAAAYPVRAAPPAGGSHCRFYSASDLSAALGRKMNITIDNDQHFDPDLFGFAAIVGTHHVSVQTTIQPMPPKELIAIGTRITKTLAGR